MRSITIVILSVLLTGEVWGQIDKGNRVFAWQIDVAQNADYDSAFFYAKEMCMESTHLSFTWSDLQPDTSTFDAVFMASFLDVLDLYYPANSMPIELQMATMNTAVKSTPIDLITTAFDNPAMIRQFKRALDTVFAHVPNLELSALNIGNESDLVMGTDSNAYAAYKVFLDSVIPHAKSLYFAIHGKELNVGTTFTHGGLTGQFRKNLCKMVNQGRDIVSVTYYPLNPDFTMMLPSVVPSDFSDLVAIYPDTSQPIYFVECGYSSSSLCNSSEAQQADFYSEVFKAWDSLRPNIPYISAFKTTDWSLTEVQELSQYYGITDTVFLEYLRTLGVRTWDLNGRNKLAFDRIQCLLKERNWCSTDCPFLGVTAPFESPELTYFPNPADDLMFIETILPMTELRLLNSQGKEEIHLSTPASPIAISSLKTGVYVMVITLENGQSQRFRFIKK
ncbi:MAG: T9SS type A sorting domain-containing protein [Vicingaceae bacterium]